MLHVFSIIIVGSHLSLSIWGKVGAARLDRVPKIDFSDPKSRHGVFGGEAGHPFNTWYVKWFLFHSFLLSQSRNFQLCSAPELISYVAPLAHQYWRRFGRSGWWPQFFLILPWFQTYPGLPLKHSLKINASLSMTLSVGSSSRAVGCSDWESTAATCKCIEGGWKCCTPLVRQSSTVQGA